MPDGSVNNLHVIVHSENGGAADTKYVGTIMDLTEFKKAHERLQASLDEKTVPAHQVEFVQLNLPERQSTTTTHA